MNIRSEKISNSFSQKLLGRYITAKLSSGDQIKILCRNALSRVVHYMKLNQGKIIINIYIFSRFVSCPLQWMFHNKRLNNRINNIHKKAFKSLLRTLKKR